MVAGLGSAVVTPVVRPVVGGPDVEAFVEPVVPLGLAFGVGGGAEDPVTHRNQCGPDLNAGSWFHAEAAVQGSNR